MVETLILEEVVARVILVVQTTCLPSTTSQVLGTGVVAVLVAPAQVLGVV